MYPFKNVALTISFYYICTEVIFTTSKKSKDMYLYFSYINFSLLWGEWIPRLGKISKMDCARRENNNYSLMTSSSKLKITRL